MVGWEVMHRCINSSNRGKAQMSEIPGDFSGGKQIKQCVLHIFCSSWDFTSIFNFAFSTILTNCGAFGEDGGGEESTIEIVFMHRLEVPSAQQYSSNIFHKWTPKLSL